MTGSIPSLVTTPSDGTTLTLNVENLSNKAITEIRWCITARMARRFETGSADCETWFDPVKPIHKIQGEVKLDTPIPGKGGRNTEPIVISIQPNSAAFRPTDMASLKGYDKLGEYAWEREFLPMPTTDITTLDSDSVGDLSQIYMRNTYIEVTTNVGFKAAGLRVPILWTVSDAVRSLAIPQQTGANATQVAVADTMLE
ncbi:hypothetical protein KIPB_004639 [Kipferlia bialata]|uniref:Uncharacterized protein n=1 Tax=Kipferlia bialata TaxID=797122 RepID=A0A9K3CU40_9EUKA|nr:hypothetical protein KIPB_004639 [Kipferlia bialata]|eukprot:g4639.t1